MTTGGRAESLEQVLDQIANAGDPDSQVTLDAIVVAVGRHAFGPVLLLAGLVTLAPIIGDIPGIPTTMGIVVILTAGQLLIRRSRIWLPDWILRRSVSREKLDEALRRLRTPVRFLDRFLRPRMEFFLQGVGLHLIAVVCILIASLMPLMEFIPFSANAAGASLTIFGLSITVGDGLLALLALTLTFGMVGLAGYHLT